ncbi:hypothetical protein Nans01_34350 [Nocardiopsis ansamitocini]|uniref:MFS transporter n=1 Tax=Nocardiopsis ansamitocini TaxID=1670832 RepID=A0A9W6UJQ6_9ACTN|nr:hypothetical protein Nans01_34350 [Nocardiopsis ansamitocini]
MALPLLALSLTRSPEAIGLIVAASWLPWLVVALPAGALTDRSAPLLVMRYAIIVRASLILGLGGLAFLGLLPLWGFAVGALVLGTAGVFSDLSAQAMVPRLVEAPNLVRANGRTQSIQITTVQLVGPAVAGYFVLLGISGSFGLLGAVYLLGLVALLSVRSDRGPEPGSQRPGIRQLGAAVAVSVSDIREGMGYFVRRPDILSLAALAAAANFALTAMMTVIPLWGTGPLGLTPAAYGLVVSAGAFGGITAGMLTHRVMAVIGERTVFRLCLPLLAGCVLLLTVRHVGALVAGLALYGMVIMFWNVASITYRQRTVPAEMFSRINAAYRWITWGVMPFAALAAGVTAGALGVPAVFLGLCVLLLSVGALVGARLQTVDRAETLHHDHSGGSSTA